MAKRLHEGATTRTINTDAERATKKIKREKKSGELKNGSDVSAGPLGEDQYETKKKKKTRKPEGAENGDIIKEAISKEAKKALKLAKKEKAEANGGIAVTKSLNGDTVDVDAVAKAERKARKRLEKAARNAKESEGFPPAQSAIYPGASALNGTSIDASPSPAGTEKAAYHEAASLTALPQTEIDAFITQKQLTVDDPLKSPYRPITSFEYLPVDESQRASFKGFSTPTPIQAACWPYVFARRDMIGVAETGSGKTLAFGVPCVRYIASLGKSERKGIKACMVSPTRELALQIHEQLVKLAQPAGLKATCVYGGTNKDEQRMTLKGTHIVVATPGRLNDFMQEGSIDLSNVDYLVLDEADRMLDKGFEQEVRKIISATPSVGRQTLMFTATWPPSVRELADTFMDKPVRVTIGDNASGELRANTRIIQEVEVIEQHEKQPRLIQLLKQYQSGKNHKDRILVFCLYKKEATRIEEFIRRRGFSVAGIHGDLSQQKRTESLEAFKQGQVPVLVATDVAARGLDIPAVKVVINVTFPLTVEDYVHRIGRTGRAGQDGRAVTMFTDAEKGLAGALINVLKAAGQPVPEELMKFGTTVKKKGHDAYGAFFKDTSDMKKATKITFD